MNFRKNLLKMMTPVSKLVGKIHLDPRRRRMADPDIFTELFDHLEVFDCILSRRKYELNNLFIPGQWTHSAIITGKFYCLEATENGVDIKNLLEFITEKDEICVLRPEFDFIDDETWDDLNDDSHANAGRIVAFEHFWNYIGKPYDFLFENDVEAFYCSELVQACYNALSKEFFKKECSFKTRKILGMDTVLPQDYYDSAFGKNKKFKIIYDSTKGLLPEDYFKKDCDEITY